MSEITFKSHYQKYLNWIEQTKAKSPLTIRRERSSLRSWAKFIRVRDVLQLTSSDLNTYAFIRCKTGRSNRAVNVDVTALANLLRFLKSEGTIARETRLVTDDWTPLKYVAPRRSLITGDTLQRLVTEARSQVNSEPKYPNGDQLADLLLFMAYSGARRQAALSAKWEHVDWTNRQVSLFTKFDKRVVVDFNAKLEAQLTLMRQKRDAAILEPLPKFGLLGPYMFPSPTGYKYLANPQRLIEQICASLGVEDFRLHDLRHFFISHCVMAGVDAMTTASWVGHSDGGVLIGKVYGHLNPQHKRDAATKVKF